MQTLNVTPSRWQSSRSYRSVMTWAALRPFGFCAERTLERAAAASCMAVR